MNTLMKQRNILTILKMDKKYISKNSSGQALFYLRVYDFMGTRVVDSNLPDLNRYRTLQIPLDTIYDRSSTEEMVEGALSDLARRIRRIDGLKRFYLPAHVLENNGGFNDSEYDPMTEEWLERPELNLTTWKPYTATGHPKTVKRIIKERILYGLYHGARLRKINKKAFENRLRTKMLIDAYLDNYSHKSIFYYFSSSSEKALLVEQDGEIRMLFFTWTAREEWMKLFNE